MIPDPGPVIADPVYLVMALLPLLFYLLLAPSERSCSILSSNILILSFLSKILGVIFKLDKESLHESLRLSRGNLAVKQTSMVHGNAFGTAFLTDGCHFWVVNIDNFKGENCFIAVGKLLLTY